MLSIRHRAPFHAIFSSPCTHHIHVMIPVSAVARATNFKGSIRFDSEKPDGQPRKVMDCSKAKAEIGWTATTSLEHGLAQTVQWYRQQQGK